MIVAILTDFGTRDHFVASVKGAILSISPGATVVDISHEIGPQNILEAAFTLGSCYRDFPEGTVFLAVVDPGVGSERRAMAVRAGGRVFVCPDNAVLSFVLENEQAYEAVEIVNREFSRSNISSTFHGRDIFAPAAAHLANGIDMSKLGPAVSDLRVLPTSAPVKQGSNLTGAVIHIDRFGNLITNLRPSDLPSGFSIEINGHSINTLRGFYAEGGADEAFAIVGSTGRIEISVNGGSAKERLGAASGQKIVVKTGAAA